MEALETDSRRSTAPAGMRLQKVPLSEQAYEELKRQILDQSLMPGQRLNIDALSRSCGISSSPLREALARLCAEGLVVLATNSGFHVAPIPGPERMRQLMEFRQVIEAHCARVGAANSTDALIQALRQPIDDMAALRAAGQHTYQNYRRFIALEQAFHETIVQSANNPVMLDAWCGLHLIISVARQSVVPQSNSLGSDAAVDEHRQILQAYIDQDPAAAEQAVQHHISQAIARMDAMSAA